MTKHLFITTILIVLMLALSCKKDQPVQEKQSHMQHYTPEAMAIWHKLNSFNQHIKNGIKSEQYLQPDSALWLLEALFNVQMGTDTTFDDVRSYHKTYKLTLNDDGLARLSQLAEVYNLMRSDLQDELDTIASDYKFLIIADLKPIESKSDDFELELTGAIGINPLSLYQPFTELDNWYYGNMLGRCDGQYLWQSDAGQELKRRFNNPRVAIHGGVNSWTDVFVTDLLDGIQFPGRIFYFQTQGNPPCITYTEMRHFLEQGHNLIYNTSNQIPEGKRPEGKHFILLDLWTNPINPPDGIYWHKYQIHYGIPVLLPPLD